jgi:hypothetical protein
MKSKLNLSLTRSSLLRDIPSLELRAPYHTYDALPFSLELINYGDQIRTIALAFFIVGLLAISSTLSFEAWLLNPAIIKENAPLELAQTVFLIAATLLQAWRAFNMQRSSLKRDIHFGLALLTFILCLREMDKELLGNSTVWSLLETTVEIITLLAMFSCAMHMTRILKIVAGNLTQILLSPTILLSTIACVFYACSLPFDRELFDMDKNLSNWFEETFELNACLLFFCAGMASSIRSAAVKNTDCAIPSPGCHEQSPQ